MTMINERDLIREPIKKEKKYICKIDFNEYPLEDLLTLDCDHRFC